VKIDLHGDDYARGARYDFAVNVSTEAHPRWLKAAIARGVERIDSYPDPAGATAAVARRHGRMPCEVVVLNGAAEAFSLLAHALRPRHPLVVHPSFTEPERALRDAGLAPQRLILPEPFELDPAGVPDDADLVVIGNPSNPTGVLHPRQALGRLCRAGRTTVVDEAFMDYVPGHTETLAQAPPDASARGSAGDTDLPGLVVVRSLTKVLGVPGARAGYLLAGAATARRLRDAAPRWSVNSIALAVIEAAVEHPEIFDRQAAATAARRATLTDDLSAIPGVRVHPASANFLLLELDDAAEVHRRLVAEHDIATRPCWEFPGLDGRHLRVAVRGDPLDSRLVAALAAICAPRASDRSRGPARPRR
jgi:histidinol-phosphate aminotransferase